MREVKVRAKVTSEPTSKTAKWGRKENTNGRTGMMVFL